jgi:hypothetical protein
MITPGLCSIRLSMGGMTGTRYCPLSPTRVGATLCWVGVEHLLGSTSSRHHKGGALCSEQCSLWCPERAFTTGGSKLNIRACGGHAVDLRMRPGFLFCTSTGLHTDSTMALSMKASTAFSTKLVTPQRTAVRARAVVSASLHEDVARCAVPATVYQSQGVSADAVTAAGQLGVSKQPWSSAVVVDSA